MDGRSKGIGGNENPSGDIMKKAILYIHGKGGSHLEAEQYRKNCFGFDIFGVDYKDYFEEEPEEGRFVI